MAALDSKDLNENKSDVITCVGKASANCSARTSFVTVGKTSITILFISSSQRWLEAVILARMRKYSSHKTEAMFDLNGNGRCLTLIYRRLSKEAYCEPWVVPTAIFFELHALVSCDMIRVLVDEQNISHRFNIPLDATWPNSRLPSEPLPTTSVNFSWTSMSPRQS